MIVTNVHVCVQGIITITVYMYVYTTILIQIVIVGK